MIDGGHAGLVAQQILTSPNADSWGLNCEVQYVYPGTKATTDPLTLYWYDGDSRPPAAAA